MKYSTEIAEAIRSHLEERDLKLVAFDEEAGAFGFMMHMPGPFSFIHYIIKVSKDDYTVVAVCPVTPDIENSKTLASMAEFVCRANYGLKNGNFELDFRDGELRYKSYVNCEDQLPSDKILHDSISAPAAIIDRYASGIINVLYKGMDPEEAVEECESEGALRKRLESTSRSIADLLRKRRTDKAREAAQEEAAEPDEADADDSFPSFEEFLQMMLNSEDEEEDEEYEEDNSDPSDPDILAGVPLESIFD